MKPLILIASMIVVLIAGCSSQTVVGPENDGRQMEPACRSINAKLC